VSLAEYPSSELRLPAIRTGSAWAFVLGDWSLVDGDELSTPLDLTGAEARFQIRRTASAPTALVSLTELAGITLQGSDLALQLSAVQTAALAPGACEMSYELQIRLPGADWWSAFYGPVQVIQGGIR
jgi:hypothetical protein